MKYKLDKNMTMLLIIKKKKTLNFVDNVHNVTQAKLYLNMSKQEKTIMI